VTAHLHATKNGPLRAVSRFSEDRRISGYGRETAQSVSAMFSIDYFDILENIIFCPILGFRRTMVSLIRKPDV